jgi:hypothetical protein
MQCHNRLPLPSLESWRYWERQHCCVVHALLLLRYGSSTCFSSSTEFDGIVQPLHHDDVLAVHGKLDTLLAVTRLVCHTVRR